MKLEPSDAWRKISSFTTSDEIHQFLLDQGVLGEYSLTDCPLARWLSRTTGYIAVVNTRFTVYVGIHSFLHTDATTEFVKRFDSREFPDLVFRR